MRNCNKTPGYCVEALESRRLLSAATESVTVGDTVFTAVRNDGPEAGSDLYRSDANGANKLLLGHWDSGDYGPQSLTAVGDKIVFAANWQATFYSGQELWASDGTVDGTKEIADLYEGASGSYPHDFHTVNGNVVFVASKNTPSNLQLYSTDGTQVATVSPFLEIPSQYSGTVKNVDYTATDVSWDYFDEASGYSDRLISDAKIDANGHTAYRMLYSEPDNGVLRTQPFDDDRGISIDVRQDDAGNTWLTRDGFTTRFRTSDIKSVSLTDGLGDDTVVVESSVHLPVTFASISGNDSFTGGGGINTLDADGRGKLLSDHTYNDDTTVTLADDGGSVQFADGGTLTLHGAFPQIVTGRGNDKIVGTSRAETILAGDGNDTIVGNGGGDSIDGGAGADNITASKTHDTIVADAADTIVDTDTTSGGDGGDDSGGGSTGGDNSGGGTTVGNSDGGPAWTYANGVVRIYGTSHDDDLRLVPSATSLKLILNGVTNKVLASKVSTVIIEAGDGDDFVWLRSMAVKSKIYGGAGNDAITTSDGKDRIYGGDGNDSIESGANHDTLYGEAGDDRVMGGDSSDYVSGGAGSNVIRGEGGVDHVVYTKLDDVHGNTGDKMDVDDIVG